MIYAILCTMLPRNPGDEPELRMHGKTFPDPRSRDEEMGVLRRQNLPFRMHPVEFEDPCS